MVRVRGFRAAVAIVSAGLVLAALPLVPAHADSGVPWEQFSLGLAPEVTGGTEIGRAHV